MKKILIPAIAMLALTGCQKAEPAKEPAAEGLDTITATIDDQTKAHLEGLKGYWDANDQITLSPQSATEAAGAIFTTEAGGASATFTGTFPETLTNGKYCAFYPVSALRTGKWNPGNSSQASSLNKIAADLPSTQSPSEITTGVYMDPKTFWLGGYSTDPTSIKFTPLLSYLKFVVPESTDYKLKKVKIESTVALAGTISVLCKSVSDVMTWSNETTSSTKSTMLQGTEANSKVLVAGTYYLAFRPVATASDVTITFTNTSENTLYSKKVTSITTKAGTIYDLGTLPTKKEDFPN